jgi:hypothetical protein
MCEKLRPRGLPFPVFLNLIDYGWDGSALEISVAFSVLGFVKQQGHEVFVGVHFAYL